MGRLLSFFVAAYAAIQCVPLSAWAGKAPPFPSWSQRIDSTKRFTVLEPFGGQAVLDGETGLVWEQAPSATTYNWNDALHRCQSLVLGGRMGWRAPAIEELTSLVDPSQSAPKLPPGHPFSDVQSAIYWSATTTPWDTSRALNLDFGNGGVASIDGKTGYQRRIWCVRGAQGLDGF